MITSPSFTHGRRRGRGTGNILEDLISSRVSLKRVKLSDNVEFPVANQDNPGQLLTRPCYICDSVSQTRQPLTCKETEILEDVISSPLLVTSVSSLCPSCCRTLESLTKLKKRIQIITQCLRALLRIRLKGQNNLNAIAESGCSGDDTKLEKEDNFRPVENGEQPTNEVTPTVELEFTDIDTENELEKSEEVDPVHTPTSVKDKGSQSEDKSRIPTMSNDKIHCSICCLNYSTEYSLNRHLRSILHQQGIRSRKAGASELAFCCHLCPEEFPVLGQLVSHQKCQHKGSSLNKLQSEDKQKKRKLEEQEVSISIEEPIDSDTIIKIDPESSDIEVNLDDVKPILCDMEFELMEMEGEEIDMEQLASQVIPDSSSPLIGADVEDADTVEEEITINPGETSVENVQTGRTKRKCAALAEELLHSILKPVSEEEETDSEPDSSMDEDDGESTEDSDSSNEGASDVSSHKPSQPTVKKYRCDPCNIGFKVPSDLKQHSLSKKHAANLGEDAVTELDKNRNFKCDGCEKTFTSRKAMRHHRLCHNGLFTCEKCGKQMASKTSFKYHMTRVHSGKPKKIHKPANRFIPPQDKQFLCKTCDKRFTCNSGLYHHVKAIHKGYRALCDLCPKEYKYIGTLNIHKKKVHGDGSTVVKQAQKRVSCDICQVSHFNQSVLNSHLELKHFPDKKNCPYGCPEEFGSESEWTSHLEECKSDKLTEASKCYCFNCREVFSTQLLRIAHHLRVHPSFPCEFCSLSFTNSTVLAKHVEAEHSEAKLWLCQVCGKGFRRKINLKVHSSTVCGDDEEIKKKLMAKKRELNERFRKKAKSHKCNKCPKIFVDEQRLKDHKAKAHLNPDKIPVSNSDEDDEAMPD